MTQDLHMLELFYRVAHTINGSLELDATLQAILQAVRDTLNVDQVTIRLLNPDVDALEPVAGTGVTQADLAALPDAITPGSIRASVGRRDRSPEPRGAAGSRAVGHVRRAAVGAAASTRAHHRLVDALLRRDLRGRTPARSPC